MDSKITLLSRISRNLFANFARKTNPAKFWEVSSSLQSNRLQNQLWKKKWRPDQIFSYKLWIINKTLWHWTTFSNKTSQNQSFRSFLKFENGNIMKHPRTHSKWTAACGWNANARVSILNKSTFNPLKGGRNFCRLQKKIFFGKGEILI